MAASSIAQWQMRPTSSNGLFTELSVHLWGKTMFFFPPCTTTLKALFPRGPPAEDGTISQQAGSVFVSLRVHVT